MVSWVAKTAAMPNPPPTSARTLIARNLKGLRKAHELTQEELAERADLHVNYIGGIERGERNVSIDNIQKLAQAFGITMSELLSESLEPTQYAQRARTAIR
jgi:transcriptional regulator with XRE-family HTH domain